MEDDVDASDPLAIIYTSGSTSTPKGVVHTHASLLEHQKILNEIRGLTAQDKLFCNSPFFWIGGIAFSILATLLAGSTLVCSNAVDAGETLDLLEAEKPTVTNGFAAGIAQLARHPSFPERDLSSMRRGNLYSIMAPDVRPADPELRHNMLGMTEAGSVVRSVSDESDQPEHRRGSFGKPAPGFETKIVDPDIGVEVGSGELCIRGPYLMQRYYKRSREECVRRRRLVSHRRSRPHRRDGFVYFIGRRGAMIKTSGANVAPAEVEKAIAKVTGGHGGARCRLTRCGARAAGRGGHRPGGRRRVRRSGSCASGLKAELSSYKIPRRFAALPLRTFHCCPAARSTFSF